MVKVDDDDLSETHALKPSRERVCRRCRKTIVVSPEKAAEDPQATSIWYCSFECSID